MHNRYLYIFLLTLYAVVYIYHFLNGVYKEIADDNVSLIVSERIAIPSYAFMLALGHLIYPKKDIPALDGMFNQSPNFKLLYFT